MKKNVGGNDRKVRIATGVALLGAAALAPVGRRFKGMLAVAGAESLVTAATGYCALNQALGVNTARRSGLLRFLPAR
jgi:hypothetical protein